MQTLRPLFLHALFALCLLATPAPAQTQPAAAQPDRALVTAAAAADRVRFAAPNRVARLKLEVFSPAGDVLFESSSRGSVLDWTLSDSQGGRLPDDSYLCVVTVKDASGRMTQRLTLVDIAGGTAAARPASVADMTARQAEAVGPVEVESAGVVGAGEQTAATLLAHDGTDGQVVTTAGDLVFRGGDFFTGRDRELMRLSSDGSLTVEGALHARGGIRFADGTVLNSAAGAGRAGKGAKAGVAAGGDGGATPSATANRLVKYADAGGTLADSAVTETGGQVGIGTDSPVLTLDVNGSLRAGQLVFARGFAAPNKGGYLFGGRGGAGQIDSEGGFFMANDGTSGGVQDGPFFILRGNAFSRIPAQRGSVFIGAGTSIAGQQAGEGAITFLTGGLDRLTINAAGNVGVGTNTPAGRLDVAGDLRVSGAGNGLIFPDGTKQTTAAAGGGNLSGAGTANTVPLWTGASTLGNSAITQSVGNVGVGTTTPASKLQVVGGASGGVSASSTGGYAVYGDNPTGWAVGAEGNTMQRRDRGGWVKAMIYVDATGSITRCFNSFQSDGGASLTGCGFTVGHTAATGVYTVGFPFAVNDRFYSLAAKAASTTEQPRLNVGINYEIDVNPNSLVVSTYLTSGPGTQTADASFVLVIY